MDSHSWLNKELYLVPYLKVTVIKSVLVLIITNTMDSTSKGENAAHQRRDPWDRMQLVWIFMKNSHDASTSALSLMRTVVQRPHLKRVTPWNTYDFTSLQKIKRVYVFHLLRGYILFNCMVSAVVCNLNVLCPFCTTYIMFWIPFIKGKFHNVRNPWCPASKGECPHIPCSRNVNFQMEQYIYKRKSSGIYIINLKRTWSSFHWQLMPLV